MTTRRNYDKTIEEEIIDYLKENELYFVEEYDEEGFPIDDEAYDLVGNLTNTELCDIVSDSMEYIAEVQRKKDIEKACEWIEENLINFVDYDHLNGIDIDYGQLFERFHKAMEDES